MGTQKIILNKNTGKKVRFCQLIRELINITDIRETEVEIEVDDRLSAETIGDMTNIFTSILNDHVARFENTVIMSMSELYGCLFETEMVAVGTNESLRSLLQSVNVTLNKLELDTNFVTKFLNICQSANICGPNLILESNQTDNYITVDGNLIATLSVCPQLLIENCAAIGWYTIANLELIDDKTKITLNEQLTGDTDNGTIRCPVVSNISRNNIETVLREKGLDI